MHKLQEAFREAAGREFAMVPAESELDYRFSRRFERSMRRIIHAQVHGYWMMVNTAAKRAAVAAAIILLLLTSALAIKPIRERVIQFFVEVYEDYFEIRFGREEKDDIDPTPEPMVRYTLFNLPNGYEEIEHIELPSLLWTHWRDENGNSISLQQELGTQEIIVDYEGKYLDTIYSGFQEIKYQKNNHATSFCWEQNEYIFLLTIYEDLPINQMLDILLSLKVKE